MRGVILGYNRRKISPYRTSRPNENSVSSDSVEQNLLRARTLDEVATMVYLEHRSRNRIDWPLKVTENSPTLRSSMLSPLRELLEGYCPATPTALFLVSPREPVQITLELRSGQGKRFSIFSTFSCLRWLRSEPNSTIGQ